MTTSVPGGVTQAQPAPRPQPASTTRQYIRYLFYKARPSWHALAPEARNAARTELLNALEPFTRTLAVLRAYSTLGTRGDADVLLWMVTETLEDFQDLQAAVLRTAMGAHLDTPYSYLAMTRRSQYIDRHEHTDGSEGEGRRTRVKPTGRKYLFVYPMVKKRPWYRLGYEERQRAMDEHIRVGHEFPRVKINTSYSFGLDDQEFVVAFETDYPADFLDLVEKLRGGDASAYTERETPIFTCVAGSIAEVFELIG
ncbi:MAG: chlorite dismutase family protein [Chloroflexi bacterium]|nr:chlorite dismutase family protein [Chloroflexota bacterium]MBV9545382.1 chlorite dismutase family protein [Chloroflexota bacterium]